MIHWTTILAAGDEKDWTNVLVIIVVLVLGVVSSIVKKVKEAQARRAAQESRHQPPTEPAELQQPIAPPVHAPPPRPARQVVRMRPHAEAVIEPQPIPTRRRQTRMTMPVLKTSEPVPQTVAGRSALEATGVDREVAQRQAEMERLRRSRAQRLERVAPAEADTGAIQARILHVPEAPRAQAEQAGISVNVSRADALRLAVLYREILAPPKAINAEPQMWEL